MEEAISTLQGRPLPLNKVEGEKAPLLCNITNNLLAFTEHLLCHLHSFNSQNNPKSGWLEVKCLPSMYKVLDLITSTGKKKVLVCPFYR